MIRVLTKGRYLSLTILLQLSWYRGPKLRSLFEEVQILLM